MYACMTLASEYANTDFPISLALLRAITQFITVYFYLFTHAHRDVKVRSRAG